jgi:hypothetical protein
MKESNAGLCTRCAVSGSQETRDILARHEQMKSAKKEAVKLHNTGLGECPECQSQNLADVPTTTPNRVRGWLLWGGLVCMGTAGACFEAFGAALLTPLATFFGTGLVLFVAALTQPQRKLVGSLLACNHCAHRWQISFDAPTYYRPKNGKVELERHRGRLA